jgi:hypothetical protein
MGILGNQNKELFGNNQFVTMWILCLVEVKNPDSDLKVDFLFS